MTTFIFHIDSISYDKCTVELTISLIGAEENRKVKRTFLDREEAIQYLQREAFWSYTGFFDRYTQLCAECMYHPGERFTEEKRKSIELLRQVIDKAHDKQLSARVLAGLVVRSKEHCYRIMPSANHPLKNKIKSMLDQLFADAAYYETEFAKPVELQFTLKKAA